MLFVQLSAKMEVFVLDGMVLELGLQLDLHAGLDQAK